MVTAALFQGDGMDTPPDPEKLRIIRSTRREWTGKGYQTVEVIEHESWPKRLIRAVREKLSNRRRKG